ncbi:MAG: DUF4031 domain-containing protein [Sedimentisphaerales bacterium]|nr:DUF4031 domain-containing protein [Sedimentisphaerales bacterium]
MPVYVDELFPTRKTRRWPYDRACHLIADTKDELLTFGDQLGLKRAWAQNDTLPHYDLTPNMRFKAIKNGAKALSRDAMVAKIKEARLRKAAI